VTARVSSALIVGYGSIGTRHAANLRRLSPDLQLTVVTQRNDVEGERMRVVDNLVDALTGDPAFAVIASPSHLHAEQLLMLLEAGVPCYVEKPPVVSVEQLRTVRERLERMSAVPATLVGCNLRFLPSLRKLRELVRSGAIGTIVRATIQAGQWLPDWRPSQDYLTCYSTDRKRGGGVILDLIHEIDQARWLFGEFDQVCAMAGKLSSLRTQSEDCACVLLCASGRGPIVSVGLDYISRRPLRRYELIGEEGTLIWDLNERRLDLVLPTRCEQIDCGPAAFDIAQTYVSAMSRWLACIDQPSEDTSSDIFDGLRTSALALRARSAAGL
jgi:predicted dehydrogenase